MKKLLKYSLLVLFIAGVLSSCMDKHARKNNYPAPNIQEPPVGTKYTIDTLLRIWHEAGSPAEGSNFAIKDIFKEDCSVYGIVTADETSGNLNKVTFIQNRATGAAIELRMNSVIDVRIGDSIRVYLKNGTLSVYKGTPQLQDLEAKNVIIYANGKNIEPYKLETITTAECGQHLCQLVTINGMQFNEPDTVWAVLHETGPTSTYSNRDMSQYDDNCNKLEGKLVARTSSYASFADQKLPQGKGTITGILTYYSGSGGSYQLSVRSINEVLLNGPRCE